MGRSVNSPATVYNTGDTVVSAKSPGYGFIKADGSYQLKSDYPILAAYVGDNALKFNEYAYQLGTDVTPFNTEYNLSGSARYRYNIATDGTKFVTSSSRTIWVSDNGIRWKPVAFIDTNTISLGYIQNIKYTGNKWFAYTRGGANADLLVSNDGETWERVVPQYPFRDLAFDGTNYVLVPINASTVYTGTSLTALTSVSAGAAASYIEKIGSVWFKWAEAAATTSHYVSTDNGATWAASVAPQGLSPAYSIANGRLFITTFTGDATARPYWVSTADGITWTSAGTTFNWSSDANKVSFGGVIWDGTRYSIGIYNSGTTSRIAYATSDTGTITTVTGANADDNTQAAMQIAYKSGVYLLTTGYQAAHSIYVFASTPTANWAQSITGDGAAYTVHPNILNQARGIFVNNKRSTKRAYITTFTNGSGTNRAVYYVEDSQGYWQPYAWGATTVRSTTTYILQGTSAGRGISGTLLGDDYTGIVWYDGTNQACGAFSLNHTAKSITHLATSTQTATAEAIFSTSKYMIVVGATYVVRWDVASGWVIQSSFAGFGSTYTGISGVSYNLEKDYVFISGVVTSVYYTTYSLDGGATWTKNQPVLRNTAGATVTLSNHLMYYVNNQFIAVQGTAFYSSSIPNYFNEITLSISGAPNSLNADLVYIASDTELYSGTNLCEIGGVRLDLSNAGSGAQSIVIYEFPFGMFSTASNASSSPFAAYAAQFRFPDGIRPSTHFKIPSVVSTDLAKSVWIYTR